MASQLRRTWILLVLALLAVLPVAAIVLRGYVADVFPRCRGTIERAGYVALRGGENAALVPLDVDRSGFRLHLDTMESGMGLVTWAKIVRVETDTKGGACECGGVLLRDQGVSNAGGALWPQADGTYVYVDNRWHTEGTAIRAVERPTHHLQRSRLVARRHLPALVAFLAMLSLGAAALRARRGILYATRIHHWLEARLEPGGRIESDGGETLGMLGEAAPALLVRDPDSSPVLVDPSVVQKRDVYRELPIVASRHVAIGSHALWRDATKRRLRDARVLGIVASACSALALGASLLAGG